LKDGKQLKIDATDGFVPPPIRPDPLKIGSVAMNNASALPFAGP
jgi:hypothetical protein